MQNDQQGQQGVIAQARAQAPVQQPTQQGQQAPVQQPVQQQPVQPAQQYVQPGFNAPPPISGFVPQPVEPQFVPQPVQTDNSRTAQQFDKLTDSNQRMAQQIEEQRKQNDRLRQELEQSQRNRQSTNQQFVQPSVTQQPQAQPASSSALPKLSDYVQTDPVSGQRWVDEERFNSDYQNAAQKIFDKATRAEETVNQYVQTANQREVARQESEAFGAYPQLNPRESAFDARLSQQTRAIIYDSMINPQDYPGQRALSFKEAADFVSGGHVQGVVPTPTVNAENARQKQQAAATVPSIPQQAFTSQEQEDGYKRLVEGTRTGSDEAIAIRLKNATHMLTDVERETAAAGR